MSRPYAVVLDYFGTLTPPIPRAELRRSVDRVAAALDIDPELFHALFVQSWPERSRGKLGGTAATIRSLVERSGRGVDDDRLAEATAVRLAEYRYLSRPRPEAAGVIDALRAGGARIGVASDCGSELVELWSDLPLARHVDAAVLSWELGAAKPAVDMFREVARRLDLPPEACLYIGDGGADELRGARRAGMTPVWLRDEAAHDASIYDFVSGDASTRVVGSLAEVVAVLDDPWWMAVTHGPASDVGLSAVNDDATALNDVRRDGSDEPVLPQAVRVLADDPSSYRLDIVEKGGSAWAVAWPGVGSHLRSMHRIRLEAGGSTRRQRHPMEAVYYVIAGEVTVEDLDSSEVSGLRAGSMAFVEPATAYRFHASDGGAELVGGPCPPDPGLYESFLED